jgi:hypothetical protein
VEDRHAVVFDVNIYLDVADLLGPPFTWEKFDAAAVTYRHAQLPNSNRQIDSLRALAVSQSGRLVANQPLEIWLSNHIEALILTKARQPKNQATPELSGLGWTGVESESILEDLARDLAYERTNGGSVGDVQVPAGTPVLSHEDGMVLAAAYAAPTDTEGAHYDRYCVTQDRDFRRAMAELRGDVTIMYAYEWVNFIRRVRRAAGNTRILKSQ